jgi:hypothetical protein
VARKLLRPDGDEGHGAESGAEGPGDTPRQREGGPARRAAAQAEAHHAEQLEAALAEQRRTGDLLGRILVERGYVSKQALGEALASQRGQAYLNLTEAPIDEELVRSLPEWVVAQYRVVPVARTEDEVLVGMVDPTDVEAMDVVASQLGSRVRPAFITKGV